MNTNVAQMQLGALYPISVKRLTGKGIIGAAAKHNLRELAAEIGVDQRIDPDRIKNNLILRGPHTAKEVASLAKAALAEAGIAKIRIDAVRALEVLFMLPSNSDVEPLKYFEEAIQWAEKYYDIPILSAVVHVDESAPHCHVLLLPIKEGRMVGSSLFGNGTKLRAAQSNFYESVGIHYGFSRPIPKRRKHINRDESIQRIRKHLCANFSRDDAVLDALLRPHWSDPEPLMEALGIKSNSHTSKKNPSFAAIMTRPMKTGPLRTYAAIRAKPMGQGSREAYPCVGFSHDSSQNERRHTQPNSRSHLDDGTSLAKV